MKALAPTARSKLKRLPERGRYDRETVYSRMLLMSVNYRSVMAFGRPRKVLEGRHKLEKMEAFVERLYPDEEEDYALPIWAGVVPVALSAGAPLDDPRLAPGTRRPAGLARLAHLGIG